MSILTCPVCQGAMREVMRDRVIIDVCTQCRGVWLDRGELEKIAETVTLLPTHRTGAGLHGGTGSIQQAVPPPDREQRPGGWDDDHDRRDGRHSKSAMGRFLDFFD